MSQRLTLPMANGYLTASYKHPAYKAYWGYGHYGWDMGNDDKTAPILGVGDGTVISAGMDRATGNTLVIKFPAVYHNGIVRDLICRMGHMSVLLVKSGEKVTRGQVIGKMGNTGAGSGAHLHIEFDTDTKYYNYTPTVAGIGAVLRNGNATTMLDPKDILTIGAGQKLTRHPQGYCEDSDINLPAYSAPPTTATPAEPAKKIKTISISDLRSQGYTGLTLEW